MEEGKIGEEEMHIRGEWNICVRETNMVKCPISILWFIVFLGFPLHHYLQINFCKVVFLLEFSMKFLELILVKKKKQFFCVNS